MNADPAKKGQGERETCDLMIVHGHVLTMDAKRTVYRDGAVAIRGRRIAAVGPTVEIEKAWIARRHDLAMLLYVLRANADDGQPGIAALRSGVDDALKALP